MWMDPFTLQRVNPVSLVVTRASFISTIEELPDGDAALQSINDHHGRGDAALRHAAFGFVNNADVGPGLTNMRMRQNFVFLIGKPAADQLLQRLYPDQVQLSNDETVGDLFEATCFLMRFNAGATNARRRAFLHIVRLLFGIADGA
jgi:hypothetical protein